MRTITIAMTMRYGVYLLFISALFVPGRRSGLVAQLPPVARAAISGGIGLAEGALVSLAVMVARARFQDVYIESPSDVLQWSWSTVPIVVAPAAGLAFGLKGEDAFAGSLLGSVSGAAIGATVGGLIGRLTSGSSEATWAGAIIGAGAGLTVGRLLLGVLKWNDGGGTRTPALSVGFKVTR